MERDIPDLLCRETAGRWTNRPLENNRQKRVCFSLCDQTWTHFGCEPTAYEEWACKNGASKYVIGVLKENHKARKVYEAWGGMLSEYEKDYVKLNVAYPEVFYTFCLKKTSNSEDDRAAA